MHALFYRHGPLSGSDAFSSSTAIKQMPDGGSTSSGAEEMKDYEQA
jgi:hypothetical protein